MSRNGQAARPHEVEISLANCGNANPRHTACNGHKEYPEPPSGAKVTAEIVQILARSSPSRCTRAATNSNKGSPSKAVRVAVAAEIAEGIVPIENSLEGSVNIRDLESQYDLVLPSDEGFETLAGFMMWRLQRVPQQGDSFVFEGRHFTVDKMDGNRVASVRVEPSTPEVAVERVAE